MNQRYISEKIKSMLPYFLLALALICAYKIVMEISFFVSNSWRIWVIIKPFFYGFLLAYVLSVPYSGLKKLLVRSKIKFLEKRKKGISVLFVYIIFVLLVFLVLNMVIPYISKSVTLFIANYSSYYAGLRDFINYMNELDFLGIDISIDGISLMIQDMLQKINFNLTLPLNALKGLSSAIFSGFLTFVSSIYILLEKDKFKVFLSRMLRVFLSPKVYTLIMEYSGRLNQNFKRYIRTQTIDAIILGTIVTIELSVLRSPYALVLGIMLGILNYVPYFGSIFGSIGVVIIVAFTQGFSTALIAAIVLLITQQIDGNVISPRLLGNSFSISPLLVIISATIGGAYAGALGMIVAIPIVECLKDILFNIMRYFERKKTIV